MIHLFFRLPSILMLDSDNLMASGRFTYSPLNEFCVTVSGIFSFSSGYRIEPIDLKDRLVNKLEI